MPSPYNKLKRRSKAAHCLCRKCPLITDKQTNFCGHAIVMFCLELHGNCVFDALGKAEPLRSTATRQMDRETAKLTRLHTVGYKLTHRQTNKHCIQFSHESTYRYSDGQTDGRTQPCPLSSCKQESGDRQTDRRTDATKCIISQLRGR